MGTTIVNSMTSTSDATYVRGQVFLQLAHS